MAKELTKDLIINILSDATYGNDALEIRYMQKENHLDDGCEDGRCFEDKCADRLLKGGHLMVYDAYGESDNPKDDMYVIDLEDLKRGWEKTADEEPQIYADMCNGNDDMFTGYNIIQMTIFGELVYG